MKLDGVAAEATSVDKAGSGTVAAGIIQRCEIAGSKIH
jgi:hypothetical protein